MDVLSDILSSLHLTGGVILEGEAHGDWCVYSQLKPEDIAALFPNGGPVIAYHYVKQGRLFAQVEGQPPVKADAGSILLFPRNVRHRLFTSDAPKPIDSHDFIRGATERGLARFTIDGSGDAVEFYCGFLGVEAGEHPLLECLPAMLKVEDISEVRERWLEQNLAFLTTGQPSDEVVTRIAELLFAEAVRAYVDDLPEGDNGWLDGLRDPAVARALSIIHARFADDLDIELLAREAGVSRTVLGERFSALLGESPMRYCAKWRMRQAANLLREGKENTANIAYRVGFNSEAAFNRAFKREFGLPPAAWKRLGQREADAHAGPQPAPIRFAHSADGTRIAWTVSGQGDPLLMPGVWFHQIAEDGNSPLWGHWLTLATHGHRAYRADTRGCGQSELHPARWTFDAVVQDLECLASQAGDGPVDLLTFSNSAAIALAYAARHPERVKRMVLVAGYAQGVLARGDPSEIGVRTAAVEMGRQMLDRDPQAFGRMIGALVVPQASDELQEWCSARFCHPVFLNPDAQRCYGEIDVLDVLPTIRAPVLLVHSRGDRVSPLSGAELMARSLPDARLVPLDSDNHILTRTEPAWEVARAAVADFLR
ncbi:alpha/beta fold hydrolase [Sphingomonas sp. BN140010]|uniref:Alpha/beta fold hydrolase n=1 Tax=Sphingomonas arvum TaxID=2992113 RepID=A0ABT3JCC5_9SPHN|nr:alpha/beta fold hydrolase [Sphingomonas sp. BN140010]MCW3796723.1 alpha/beta fold hydrolase [Sphingomonas sp. BN140010]